jgi:hypothetical protein
VPGLKQKTLTRICSLLLFLLVLSWGAYYIYEKGFGRRWRGVLAKEFGRFGLQISVRRLTLDPFRGLVAKDVEIYDSQLRQTVLAEVSDLILDVNYANLFQQEPALNAVDLRDAKITIPLDPGSTKSGRILITQLHSRIYFFPGRIELRQITGDLDRIQINASGTLVNPSAARLTVPPESDMATQETATERLLNRVVEEIKSVQYSGERPQLSFVFQVDLANPSSIRIEGGHLIAASFSRFNHPFRNLDAEFSLENQRLEFRKLFLRDARGEFFGTGTWNVETGDKQFQLRSSLNLADLLVKDFPWVKDWKFDAPPQIEMSGVYRPGNDWQFIGRLNFDQFLVQSVPFQSLKADFSKVGNAWMISNAELTHRTGTLSGDLLNLPGDFRLRINSGLNPSDLLPLFPPRVQKLFSRWDFLAPPVVQATIKGNAPELGAVSGSGRIWLGRTKLGGALMNSASADFEIDHKTVRWDQVRAMRDEGSATGTIVYDFSDDQITLRNVLSNLDPTSLTTWIHPELRKIMRPFHFAVLPTVHVDGSIRLKTSASTVGAKNLQIRIDTPNPFIYQVLGLEMPCESGSGDFSIVGDENPSVDGVINLGHASIGKLPLFEPLISRLGALGFRQPAPNTFGVQLKFKLDSGTLQVLSLLLVNGTHTVRLNGSVASSGGAVDLNGSFDSEQTRIHCAGTVLDPDWQVSTVPIRR